MDRERCSLRIEVHESMSYFARNPKTNLCWFMETKLEEEIKTLHNLVGNANVDDHFIIVGNGSSQLIQASIFALSSAAAADSGEPVSVVCEAPYYSVSFVLFCRIE